MDLGRLSASAYLMLAAEAGLLGKPGPTAARPHLPGRAAPAAPVTLDPKVGPNLRLGDESDQLPADFRAQAEPHLVRSFTDAGLVVATLQEGRFTDGGAVDCGYAISQDGGQTWQRGLIPHLTTEIEPKGEFLRASDPVAALDLQGNIYLNTIGLKGQAPDFINTILVSKSTDGGQTFGEPSKVAAAQDTSVFLDKNWIAINTFAGTPTAHRVVVTLTYIGRTNRSDGVVLVQPIVAAFSDDGAQSWSDLRVVSPSLCQGSQPVFLPDGSLAVVYWNFSGAQGEQIEIVLSEDGGDSYGQPRLVTPVTRFADPVARSTGFSPSVATDQQAGVIYVTYQAALRQGANTTPVILFTKSIDKGRTWGTPARVNDTPPDRSVFNPAIAVSPDGQHVTIAFYDKRHDPGDGLLVDLYLAESFDGGETWGPNLRLSDVSSDLMLAPLTPSGRMIGDYHGIVPALNFDTPGVVVWVDTRTGSADAFSVSVDRTAGTTFEAWRRLRFSPAGLANVPVSGEAADPDLDGLPNVMEYALGRDPKRWEESPLHSTHEERPTGGTVSVAFEPMAVLSDVRFSWQTTSDFVQWLAATPNDELRVEGRVPATQRIKARFPTDGSASRFFRFGVVRVGPAP